MLLSNAWDRAPPVAGLASWSQVDLREGHPSMSPITRRFPVRLVAVAAGPVLALALVLSVVGGSGPAAAAPVSQCSNVGSVQADTITCAVTVTNNFAYNAATPATPTGLATIVTTVSCTGSAICVPGSGTTTSTLPVTDITQCNGAGLGGASTVTCTATVTNNLTGYPVGAAIDSTVTQCQSPGTVNTLTCVATPPGNNRTGTFGAGAQSVSQCNASGGAGGTMTCTVTAPPSQSTGLPTTINQCNGSGKTGASTVTCTATITDNFTNSIPATGGTTTLPGATTTTAAGATTTTTTAGATTTTTTVGATTTTAGPRPTTTTTSPVVTTPPAPTGGPRVSSGTGGIIPGATGPGGSIVTPNGVAGVPGAGSVGTSTATPVTSGPGSPGLPFTGAPIAAEMLAGLGAILAGALVLLGARRRGPAGRSGTGPR